jgi:hypothetical protein
MEKPRKDFKELVGHHIVSLALIGLSYRFHFTYMGLGVFITHDISDFFLAVSLSSRRTLQSPTNYYRRPKLSITSTTLSSHPISVSSSSHGVIYGIISTSKYYGLNSTSSKPSDPTNSTGQLNNTNAGSHTTFLLRS